MVLVGISGGGQQDVGVMAMVALDMNLSDPNAGDMGGPRYFVEVFRY